MSQHFLQTKLQNEVLILVFLVVLTAVIYSSFNWGLPWRFNSPDEATNAYFARSVSEGNGLSTPAPLNNLAGDSIVRPRSTHLIDNNSKLVLAGFLGLPILAGFLGSIFGNGILPYVTSLGAILGLLCFYFLWRDLLDRRTAIISTILLAFLPAFWYYHSRSFFHNALFFDFALLAVFATHKMIRTKNWWYYLLAGLGFGIALSLRGSELFWLSLVGICWLVFSRKDIVLKFLPLTLVGIILGLLPVLVSNYYLYGHFIAVGYQAGLNISTSDPSTTSVFFGKIFLPFGFHPRVMWYTGLRYLWQLSWWWASLVLVSLVCLVWQWKKLSQSIKVALILSLVASISLFIIYGSWLFHDNPDPQAITVGTAYVRYWLPLYAVLLWPIGLLLSKLWEKDVYKKLLVIIILTMYGLLSFKLVVLDSEEGLMQMRNNIKRFEQVSQLVQKNTEVNSVIVSLNTTDKFFWPERQVISQLGEAEINGVNKLLKSSVPVYLFRPTLSNEDLLKENNDNFKKRDLFIKPVLQNLGEHSLYKFKLLE